MQARHVRNFQVSEVPIRVHSGDRLDVRCVEGTEGIGRDLVNGVAGSQIPTQQRVHAGGQGDDLVLGDVADANLVAHRRQHVSRHFGRDGIYILVLVRYAAPTRLDVRNQGIVGLGSTDENI